MKLKNLFLIKNNWLCVVILFVCCDPTLYDKTDETYDKKIVPYDINNPDEKLTLENKLEEISGLVWYNGQLATIDDDKGTVFILNLSGKIIDEVSFDKGTNYEGIAVADERIFVVQGKGTIHEISMPGKEVKKHETPLSGKNDVEGLAYDKANNRLILACKNKAGIDDNIIGRALYSFDLERNSLSKKPVVVIEGKELNERLAKRDSDFQLGKFAPSGIAIHPESRNIFILSHQGKTLVVLDSNFKLLEVVKLSAKIFKQPEGICFSPQGTLYISNEGSGGRGNILKFSSGFSGS